jgi:NAD-dependent dihydropyrimidine dehydrogenase PreA subunit
VKNKIVNIDQDLCTGCAACIGICPVGILFLDESGLCQVSDESKCDRLRGCERACPTGAIVIS